MGGLTRDFLAGPPHDVYRIGGPTRDFLAGQLRTTLGEMYQFIYYLLAAVEQNSGATVRRTDIPAPPTYLQNHIYNQQPPPQAHLQNYIYNQQQPTQQQPPQQRQYMPLHPTLFGTGVYVAPTQLPPGQLPRRRRLSVFETDEMRSADDAFYEAVRAMYADLEVREIPLEDKRAIKTAIEVLYHRGNQWLDEGRDLDCLLAFRSHEYAFFTNEVINRHYVTTPFLGRSEDAHLQSIHRALRELRFLSNLHYEINRRVDIVMFNFPVNLVMLSMNLFFSCIECLSMMSFFPLFDITGFDFPLTKSMLLGIFLCEEMWEMPFRAWREYLEALNTTLFVYIPMLLLFVALSSSLTGLCVALIVPGLEILPMMALFSTQALLASSIALFTPTFVVLVGRGLFEGVQRLYHGLTRAPDLDVDQYVPPTVSP